MSRGNERIARKVTLAASMLVAVVSARGAEVALAPVSASGNHSIVGNEIILDDGGQRVFLEIQVSGWDPDLDGSPVLMMYQAQIDTDGFVSGAAGTAVPAEEPCTDSVECEAAFGYGAWCRSEVDGMCTPGFVDTLQPEYVFACCSDFPAVNAETLVYQNMIVSAPYATDPGVTQYGGTLVLDVSANAIGTFTIGFVSTGTFLWDPASADITPLTLTPALITIPPGPPEVSFVPVDATGNHTIVGNDISITGGGQSVTFEIRLSGWFPALLKTYQARVDSAGFTSGASGSLSFEKIPCTVDEECADGGGSVCLSQGFCGATPAAYIDDSQLDFVFYGEEAISIVDVSDDARFAGFVMDPEYAPGDPGIAKYGGTLVLDVAHNAGGVFTVGFDSEDSYMRDDYNLPIGPLTLTPGRILVTQPPHQIFETNRYISLTPQDPGLQTALRVTLVDLPDQFGEYEGSQMWIGPPRAICENAAQDSPPPEGCGPAPGAQSDTMISARLQGTQHCTDFGAIGLLHATGCEIVPSATYDVQSINCAADPSDEANYSTPTTIHTSTWGDICSTFDDAFWAGPDGAVDVTLDVTACLDKFRNEWGAPIKARADVEPNVPDRRINIADVSYILDAFSGDPFSFTGPGSCP